MHSGREQLADWIERRGMNQREAARILGMDFTVLNKILLGHRTPGLATALAIQRHTGISVEVWMPTDDGKTDVLVTAGGRKRRIGK
jgi:transcriptional regulator with XRE-family HTH domain